MKEHLDPGPVITHQGAFALTEKKSKVKADLSQHCLPFGNCLTPWPQDISQNKRNKQKKQLNQPQLSPRKGVLEKC